MSHLAQHACARMEAGRGAGEGRDVARARVHALVPDVRDTGVLPGTRAENMPGALMSYQSLRVKGSAAFFLPAVLPLPPLPSCDVWSGE